MNDFGATPPPGPPPPKVPEGWKAQWNDQYKEWFYVNIYTKKSQWDKPTEPIYPPNDDAPPGPPPGYSGGGRSGPTDVKQNPYGSPQPDTESDAALAARLQAEEDERARNTAGSRGAMQDYANTPMPQSSSPGMQDLPPREQKRGLLGKFFGKSNSSNQYQQQPQYGQQQYRPQQPAYGYGAPPPQQYGGYPQQGYPPQGYAPQGYGPGPGYGGGGYGGYQQQQQQPPKKSGGLGTMGGAALGLGGGLIGGMLLEDAIQDHDQSEYQQGYDQGQDNNGGDGGDYGGGDDGGGGGDF